MPLLLFHSTSRPAALRRILVSEIENVVCTGSQYKGDQGGSVLGVWPWQPVDDRTDNWLSFYATYAATALDSYTIVLKQPTLLHSVICSFTRWNRYIAIRYSATKPGQVDTTFRLIDATQPENGQPWVRGQDTEVALGFVARTIQFASTQYAHSQLSDSIHLGTTRSGIKSLHLRVLG